MVRQDGAEHRKDYDMRALMERAAELGAERALRKFEALTPYDLTTHEGREGFRTTLEHAHTLRVGCEAIKREGWRVVGKAFWTVFIAVLLAGAIYSFGIDPNKFKMPGG